jgi:mannose-6-phosphate isomerase-like protein (cupin superfamily)
MQTPSAAPQSSTAQGAGRPSAAPDGSAAQGTGRHAVARFDGSGGPRIIGPRDGHAVDLQSLGVRFLAWGAETGGGFSLVEHPIPPRMLCAPLHRHSLEDEYSFVLEGRMGAQLGDDVVYAGPGDFVFKPRNQWHTFWNAGDEPCRILEIISPAGFENFFAEIAEQQAAATDNSADSAEASLLDTRYGIEFDYGSIERLCSEHGLRFPVGG